MSVAAAGTKPAWAEKRRAWIADYEMMVDEDYTVERMAKAFNMTVPTFRTRVQRYGCYRPNRRERALRDLIAGWIERKCRFTHFDLPFWVTNDERSIVIGHLVESGEIEVIGESRPYAGGSYKLYGKPDWPERKPTISVIQDVKLSGALKGNAGGSPDDSLYDWPESGQVNTIMWD